MASAHEEIDLNECVENNETAEDLERKHFRKVVSAFLHYGKFSNLRIDKAKKDFLSLNDQDRKRLPKFLENLEKQKQCVAANFEFIKQIIGHTGKSWEGEMFGNRSCGKPPLVRYQC